MSLIKVLNTRFSLAKSFTKPFHDEVKRNIDDCEAVGGVDKSGKKNGVYNRHVSTSRYEITIPYIFATLESMIASFFENMPDIVISGRTSESNKAEIIKAVYAYLVDVADLDEFLSTSAWWFFLTGMVKADVEYKVSIEKEIPQLDSNGKEMVDENNEPVTVPEYEYNDPIATVDNPLKVYFSPESEFSIDGKKIPYYVKERLVNVDEIKEVYGVEVDADEQLDIEDMSSKDEKESKEDISRAKVFYYYGILPSTVQDELKERGLEWSFDKNFKCIYTKEKILLLEETEEKPCKLARCYATLNKFFGYGIGKTLRPFQEDMSVRRSQQLAYADRFAYPWLVLPNGVKVDPKSIMDYKKTTPLTYSSDGQKPEYLSPPQMPSVITDADNAIRSDAQFVSGTLDLSKGAQQTNTVKTATGQQLFAQSQDKRLNKARKALAKYYREVVIQMFKLARDNWAEEHKKITYMTDDGQTQELEVSAEDLKDIDFDTDIDFNLDSVSVNQDIMSQRWISLLETAQNVPVANMKKIWEKVLKESYKIPNPEAYSIEEQPPMDQEQEQMPGESAQPVENPESLPSQESLGSQLAPTPPYAG